MLRRLQVRRGSQRLRRDSPNQPRPLGQKPILPVPRRLQPRSDPFRSYSSLSSNEAPMLSYLGWRCLCHRRFRSLPCSPTASPISSHPNSRPMPCHRCTVTLQPQRHLAHGIRHVPTRRQDRFGRGRGLSPGRQSMRVARLFLRQRDDHARRLGSV